MVNMLKKFLIIKVDIQGKKNLDRHRNLFSVPALVRINDINLYDLNIFSSVFTEVHT